MRRQHNGYRCGPVAHVVCERVAFIFETGICEIMGAIVGLGTDITEIVRIGTMIERHGELFLQRVYTEEEIKYCQRHKEALQHYAGRWAAKEAVMKALGTGFTKGVGWKEIQVAKTQAGRPLIELAGSAARVAAGLGIDEILVTISHCRAYATATAIAVQHGPRRAP